MDAIRKKMQSLKSETDGLYAIIDGFEKATKVSAAKADQVYFPTDADSILRKDSIRNFIISVTRRSRSDESH